MILRTLLLILIAQVTWCQIGQPGQAPGQVPLDPGYQQPLEPIKNILQGSYGNNVTLYFRNSPYRVMGDLTVEYGVTMDIETGTRLYFDTGVGLIVKGTLRAIGNEFAHIEMLPYQQQINYDSEMPKFRLVDGPTVRQGRLQVQFRDRWRSVCTMVTNWTSIDTGTACRSMGYSDGGFWKWMLRNNDTYPFVMPRPDCHGSAKNLWDCPAFSDPNKIRLSENLCQGEDDLGIYCWGPPTFQGWARHWKGIQILNSPFHYVNSDPDLVAVNRESNSRLEFVDILYAGYDGSIKNVTSALYIEGVPPIMNGLRIEHSARDGLQLLDTNGPAIIANSTFSHNRGHGIFVVNTTDARIFINNTRIEGNWGDGIWYKQRTGVTLIDYGIREKRGIGSGRLEEEKPRIDMCGDHKISDNHFFPHLISVNLKNRTFLDPSQPSSCWMTVSLPPRLPYTYSLQWLHIRNLNPSKTQTTLLICDSNNPDENHCSTPRFRIPIRDQIYPQSVSLKSSGKPLYLALEHVLDSEQAGYVQRDVHLLFNIHASVLDKAYYGLNVTNCIIEKNTGNGVFANDIRERTSLTNVTLDENQGYAGFLVKDGAADIWLNETRIFRNWGDGMNISYAGGSIMVNGTRIENNRWRGAAIHYNQTIPFFPLYNEVIFKGRPSNNKFYLPTVISENEWGGLLIGNYCAYGNESHWRWNFKNPPIQSLFPKLESKILISWVEFLKNQYHPSLEIFSCRDPYVTQNLIDITGNRIDGNLGFGMRISPAVNMHTLISSNQFLHNNDTALYVRNAQWPELANLPAEVTISKNVFKFNHAKYIISIGMNEDANKQFLTFNQQNEIRANTVFDPFPSLPPRSTPYAALVVSSSNVRIHRNCFNNERAKYEIATELERHAKWIDARENNWGFQEIPRFIDKFFDQFNRYSLASIDIDPYMAACNQRMPYISLLNGQFRQFKKASEPNKLGGIIYENHDLLKGRYTVTEDLQVVPGAKLTIASGSTLEFQHGIGMIVQGDLIRNEYDQDEKVIFTSTPFTLQKRQNIRLVDSDGNDEVTEGRLEVLVDEQWGTVCNRSWTPQLTILACNQLGLVADVQYFENWRIFPEAGDLPMVMDNIRCEENEVDITRCRHDGIERNCAAGCRGTEVVGLRCLEPRWAGVRYSLLANPPTVTGQTTMDNWRIEKGGLFNFRTSEFCAAFKIDWNYHTFHRLEIKNNFWDGVDVVYNDLVKKPAIRNSVIYNNRNNGFHIRSAGITVENVTISFSGQSGMRYNPSISALEQEDIVSWLSLKEQPELEANNIFRIPDQKLDLIEVMESNLNQRKFLVAADTEDCPEDPLQECVYNLMIRSVGYQYGLASKMTIQIVNPPSNISDEDAIFTEVSTGKSWSARKDQIYFPVVSTENAMRMRYTKSYGKPKLVILVLFLDTQEYVDRFIHLYQSRVEDNQYGFSAVHYSNLTFSDGRLSNRWNNEKIWLQKVNFTRNHEAVVWLHSPQHSVVPGTPIAEITYHFDNCSVVDNTGPIIESHRDLYASANVFHWILWSNTFANNTRSGIAVALPDTYDLLAKQTHSFWLTENRFERNDDFRILLDGYYAFANISSNNFTQNLAPYNFGMLELRGMEKKLVCERNRFFFNWGHWMIKIDATSQYLRQIDVPSYVRYNYIEKNKFIRQRADYVDMWPRSYALGVFGAQKIEVHFNRFFNELMDFELVSGTKYTDIYDTMNATYNWWGTGNEAVISQRVFDFDDWNTYTRAIWSPFYVSNDLSINFWWNPHRDGQLANATYLEPSIHDLHGRVYEDKNLTLITERWYEFPHYYRPFRPYRITRDVTIMPGATLYIQENVEVHIWPNVRILVLGNLVAKGSYWQPIRFKPINTTEYAEIKGRIPSEYRKKRGVVLEEKKPEKPNGHHIEKRPGVDQSEAPKSRPNRSDRAEHAGRPRRASDRSKPDLVYRDFPTLHRDDPYYQRFTVSLTANGSDYGRSGFLQIYNATTGEIVPSCDRQFTIRNAQVVCRELGMATQNVYHWLTPRWDYNPQIQILKTYMEPRECRGDEPSLDRCNLRLSGRDEQWMCMDSEHFNYIYCGTNRSLSKEYIGNWGGITFAQPTLEHEYGERRGSRKEKSILQNVEIVGGGAGHNDSWQSAGLQIFHRSPILDHVNVTNCSVHGVQIVSPNDHITLANLNVTFNQGKGVNIITTFVQAPSTSQDTMRQPMSISYYSQGMLDMCAAVKRFEVKNRIMFYYKYDSYPVDCVKIFTSPGRRVAFRIVQYHLYSSPTDLGRSDALRLYSSDSFSPSSLLADFRSDYQSVDPSVAVSSEEIAVHLRATAADGVYGFIAEVSALPSNSEQHTVGEVVIRGSRMDNNDRGAIEYSNLGEMSPNLVIESSSFSFNGIHLFGNVSTSSQAIQLHLHNTVFFLFRSNSIAHNRGGLYISATSSSPVVRLGALVKNCMFVYNSNSTTVALSGNNYQSISLLNNVISHNYALYHDTVVAHDVSINMTRNTLYSNTGLHTLDIHANSRISADKNLFFYNHFYDNLALGHGQQYIEKYGYQPLRENNEFLNRPRRDTRDKRQVLTQQGVSFDWWTHVDNETTRYRSTIIAGSSQEIFKYNTFNDPLNDYELTTGRQSQYEIGSIDARDNYWGYPGTIGVAAGKIRDAEDYPELVKVQYSPVMESNTSLVEGDCPAGWFQAGHEEFKSCFLFVPAAVTYTKAVEYCKELGAFVPYLRIDDVLQTELAKRIEKFSIDYITDQERLKAYGVEDDIHLWISSVGIPNTQCGWLSARSRKIGSVNCNLLLPFVCEKGTHPYSEPILWRPGIIIPLVIASVILALLLFLVVCWCVKSRERSEELSERKNIVRASFKLQKREQEYQKRKMKSGSEHTHTSAHASLDGGSTISAYDWRAGRQPPRQVARSPTDTLSTATSDHTYSYAAYTPHGGPTTGTTVSGTFQSRRQNRHVSTNPNGYSEITNPTTTTVPYSSSTVTGTTVKMRAHQMRSDTTSDVTSCSTCPSDSERTSTATDISSNYTSEASESTIQSTVVNHRRSPRPPRSPIPAIRRSNQFLNMTNNFQPLPTDPPRPPPPPLHQSQSSLNHFVELHAPPRTGGSLKSKKPVIETSM
ncbi:Protein CBG18580 [Caenorhabditis briggsae]|uniref:Protein CBG18580 n=2 Tax=Caenorhabditis briggsae TaxID=6238 RepID=A8XTM5_CAEBR|nr:Protein CBG18580 [Caenorhabditis briggsae]CAP36001.2 Protein CBG18580 [Caenorhabditis briggsae]